MVLVWEIAITGSCAFLGYAAAGAMGLTGFMEILFIGLLARGGPTLLDEVMRRLSPTIAPTSSRRISDE